MNPTDKWYKFSDTVTSAEWSTGWLYTSIKYNYVQFIVQSTATPTWQKLLLYNNYGGFPMDIANITTFNYVGQVISYYNGYFKGENRFQLTLTHSVNNFTSVQTLILQTI